MILFANISSDAVFLSGAWWERVVPRKALEYDVWPLLVSLYRQFAFEQVYIINGPGSFTNLRLACLAFNSLAFLVGEEIKFFCCDKLQIYASFHQQWLLPRTGLLYIGQQKNIWLSDVSLWTFELTIKNVGVEGDYFLDQCVDFREEKKLMVHRWWEKGLCSLVWDNKKMCFAFDQLPFVGCPFLVPNYMIEASIGPRHEMQQQ